MSDIANPNISSITSDLSNRNGMTIEPNATCAISEQISESLLSRASLKFSKRGLAIALQQP